MTLHRSMLCALALTLAMPAEAAFIRPMRGIRIMGNPHSFSYRVVAVVGDDTVTNAVEATVASDAGDEDVTLVESDAWLHGGASIAALPKAGATLTLTLYDSASASLMSFSGTLGTDGSVTLAPDATKDTHGGGACAASSRTGCADDTSDTSDTSDTTTTTPDIEVLAGEVFAASTGYELGLDLAGADTYAAAYAEITVTESDEVTTCSKETTECTTTGSTTTATAEVAWDEIGAVWEGELTLEPEGVIEVKVKARDAMGEELDSTKLALAVPWSDDGEGVNVLAIDEDPLTRLAFHRGRRAHHATRESYHGLTVVSGGWTRGDSLPVDAEVELTNGDTVTIPVNSYQRLTRSPPTFHVDSFFDISYRLTVTGADVALEHVSLDELTSPGCSGGLCVVLVQDDDGQHGLSFTVYGTDATGLPDDLELTVTITDEAGEEVYSGADTVEFDDEITAVFANEIGFSEDPIGLDLSGKVSLLGDADGKGKQQALAKGKFCGSFSRDGDGDLSLAGADKDEVVSSGDIVVNGEAIGLDDGQGGLDTPPVIMYGVLGNGSGTKNPSSQTSARPQLL